MIKSISVIGSDGVISEEISKMAQYIGSEIAEKGFVLVCGGRGGVMEAACKGAKEKGGITMGILPSLDKGEANKYVDIALTTGLGLARNHLVVAASDASIALSGSTGTLSEISIALNIGKRVVIVNGSGGVSDKICDSLNDERIQRIIRANYDEAVDKALMD